VADVAVLKTVVAVIRQFAPSYVNVAPENCEIKTAVESPSIVAEVPETTVTWLALESVFFTETVAPAYVLVGRVTVKAALVALAKTN
jgi:hypothetical protein